MTDNPSATGAVMIASQILSNAEAISAGDGHSLVLCSDGTVIGFGDNYFGEATGFTNENDYPYRANGQVRIGGQTLSNVVSIVAGHGYSLALKRDGTLITWGDNYIPPGLGKIKVIAAEQGYNWVLKSDETAVGWASPASSYVHNQLLPVENLTNIVNISLGSGGYGTRGIALKNDGTVGIWGTETIHRDATPPAGLSNVIAIAAGYNHSLALTKDGTVTGWGFNEGGQATGIPTLSEPCVTNSLVRINGQVLSNVVAIAANHEYSLALKNDGTVVGWGHACPGVPEGLSNVVAISAGRDFCLAITTNLAVAEKFQH